MATPTHAPQQDQDVDLAQFRGQAPSEEDQVSTMIMMLEPGDEKHLATLLQRHPQMREQIVQAATAELGSQFVGKALAILAGAAEKTGNPEAAGAPSDPDGLMKPDFDAAPTDRKPSDGSGDELMSPDWDAKAEQQPDTPEHPRLDDDLMNPYANETAPAQAPEPAAQKTEEEFDYTKYFILEGDDKVKVQELVEYIHGHPNLRAKVLEGVLKWDPHLFDEVMRGLACPEPETQPAPVSEAEIQAEPTDGEKAVENKVEAGWVTRAKEYNKKHRALVDRFIQLTLGACMSETEPDVDPVKVSDWQAAHGVPPDGRVGAATVEAAENEASAAHEKLHPSHAAEPDATA